ncbi:hypothetical protein OKA05_23915 [Luteolibacter arcticus]|uniref:Uncharacterized protein n=1 Tax=Luteolibacter arcticus TaxID=1581411 RepID=A0ABT3GQ32_9BACT|nr:hypothetical protein [Luteolibacter arcticus]MCW1925626.1 hypothetical protein [Luteolibacter arcticus]
MSKLELAVVLIVVAVCVAVIAPVFMKQRTAADRTSAISSLKVTNLELINFDNDYGRFPDASTIADVKEATKTTLALGTTTSNDFFRQLLATRNTSERIFWAPAPGKRRKPNDILGDNALAKGECIHSYIAGLSKNDRGLPLVMAPMIPGTTRFDPIPYGDKAVVLRIDGSASPESLDKEGRMNVRGKDPLDPSNYWNGKAPDLKWPE